MGDTPSPPTTPIQKKEKEKKVSWRIINFEKVQVMVNNNMAILGTHAGLMIGESGQSGSRIYDPAGSYDPCEGKKNCITEEKIGSDRVVYDKNTDFKHYVQQQISDNGANVYVFSFKVREDNVDTIKSRIDAKDGGFPGQCASLVANAISGIEPFGVVSAIKPKELKRIMEKLKEQGK